MFLLIIAMLAVGFTCSCAHKGTDTEATKQDANAKTLSDESEIRVTVCEYLIREVIKPSPELVLFTGLDSAEQKALSSRVPGQKLSSAKAAQLVKGGVWDKTSAREGLIISISNIRTNNDTAVAYGGYLGGAGVTFEFLLEKQTAGWAVKSCSSPIIAH